MPDLYALTAPKLFAVVRTFVSDEDKASHVLSKVYQHIWKARSQFGTHSTMSDLIEIATRFARDHKMAGQTIPRGKNSRTAEPDLSDLSDTDLNVLHATYRATRSHESSVQDDFMSRDALHGHLSVLIKEGPKS